jgi:hypothetical protein
MCRKGSHLAVKFWTSFNGIYEIRGLFMIFCFPGFSCHSLHLKQQFSSINKTCEWCWHSVIRNILNIQLSPFAYLSILVLKVRFKKCRDKCNMTYCTCALLCIVTINLYTFSLITLPYRKRLQYYSYSYSTVHLSGSDRVIL